MPTVEFRFAIDNGKAPACGGGFALLREKCFVLKRAPVFKFDRHRFVHLAASGGKALRRRQ